MPFKLKTQIKVADEVWIAAALLQREKPNDPDFAIEEIVERARREALHEALRPGVYVHIVQHRVANRSANPGRYRMLFETSPGRRRLFREGDNYHPSREGAKITPEEGDIPDGYAELLSGYRKWSERAAENSWEGDPLLAALGSGKTLWLGEPADEYVKRLREDCE